MHRPLPLQSFSQLIRSHALPSNPALQSHLPVIRSHTPMFEQTANEWAVSVAVATSVHASPYGHALSEQSGPVNPSKHAHAESAVQTPFNRQSFGHTLF
jgi:hypothetical protein